MDNFEKQQAIEAIKRVVNARWFFTLAIGLQGLVLKAFIKEIPLPTATIISFIVAAALAYNFLFWLYLRRPQEKITPGALKFIKFLQVLPDQLAISAVLYFSGTANKLLMVMYFISIINGVSLYNKKGVVLATLSAGFFYSGLVMLEYFGLLAQIPVEILANNKSAMLPLVDISAAKTRLISFNMYLLALAFITWYLSDLFRVREKRLQNQRSELIAKTDTLTVQARQLTETKNWLHEALTKSDKVRAEQNKLREEIEKTNEELRKRVRELETFDKVTIGRELKMAELKKEMDNLKGENQTLKQRLVRD